MSTGAVVFIGWVLIVGVVALFIGIRRVIRMANVLIAQRDTQLERQRAGFIALSLTNFDNDNEPAIAAGSVVEIAGSVYSVTTNEAITGWAGVGDGPVWIKLEPDGTDPFTAEYTDVAPTWSDANQGWYGTGGESDHRYVAGLTKAGAGGYADKGIMRAAHRGVNRLDGPLFIAGSFPFSRRDLITATGSWTVPEDVHWIRCIVTGGGGEGGGEEDDGGDGSNTEFFFGADYDTATRRVRATAGQGGLSGSPRIGGRHGLLSVADPAIGSEYSNALTSQVGQNSISGTSDRYASGGASYWGWALVVTALPVAYGAGGAGLIDGEGSGGGSGVTIEAVFAVSPGEVWTATIGAGGSGGDGFNGIQGVVAVYY